MALDIVYGYQGKDHVKASQLARLLSGTIGGGRYVLDTQDGLEATMQTANKVRIGTGDLVMDGRYITNEAYQELTVESGQSGYNRNDIVGVQYTRASGSDVDHSIETPTLKVLKGTQTTGSASDPAYTAGDIAAGDASAFMPLWRLPITGLNVGTPVQMFEKITPFNEFRDSVSRVVGHYESVVLIGINNGKVLWTNSELADKLGINQQKIDRSSCIVSCCNGDLSANQYIVSAWISETGDLNVMANGPGYIRINIGVIYIGS